jgi:hypothetical protein
MKCFMENEKVECLLVLVYMQRLASQVPDHKLCIALFRHQGIFCRNIQNYEGSLRSFQRMRDAAEDCGDHLSEMEAYLNVGKVF